MWVLCVASFNPPGALRDSLFSSGRKEGMTDISGFPKVTMTGESKAIRPSAPKWVPNHLVVEPLGLRVPRGSPILFILVTGSLGHWEAREQPWVSRCQIPSLTEILGVPWKLPAGELKASWGKVEKWRS